MDSLPEVKPQSVPLPNPTIVLPSSGQIGGGGSITKPKLDAKILLFLVVVFTFVSIMIGLLIWIVQYEVKKRSSNFLSLIER